MTNQIANNSSSHDGDNELPKSLQDALEVLARKESMGQGLPEKPAAPTFDDNCLCVQVDIPMIIRARVHLNRITGEVWLCEPLPVEAIEELIRENVRLNNPQFFSQEVKERTWKRISQAIEASQKQQDSSTQEQNPAGGGALDEETRIRLEALAGQVNNLTTALQLLANAQAGAATVAERLAWLESWVRTQEEARAMALEIAEEELEAEQDGFWKRLLNKLGIGRERR